jgi:hypothetical protein
MARQRDQMPTILRAEKTGANHAPSESTDPRKARNFSRLFIRVYSKGRCEIASPHAARRAPKPQ